MGIMKGLLGKTSMEDGELRITNHSTISMRGGEERINHPRVGREEVRRLEIKQDETREANYFQGAENWETLRRISR